MRMNLQTAALAAALALGGTASAQAVTITGTTPTWTNIVGGTNTDLNVRNGTFTDARWGVPAGQDKKGRDERSGLGFDPAAPPRMEVATDTSFLLGTLRHYNNAIMGGTAASGVGLDLFTTIRGADPVGQTFHYNFNIDETPNQRPCEYPSGRNNPCADKITFENLDTTASLRIDGIDYTLVLSGFSDDGGRTFTDGFISQEGSTNSAALYARLTAITAVPEPLSVSLLGAGLVATGLMRRRRV